MDEIKLAGGTVADREDVTRLHELYLEANARFDREMLEPIFSDRADATYFNLNGFAYHGREHWLRLWTYYATQVQSSYWQPYEVGGFVDANAAIIWCQRRCHRRWTGDDTPVRDIHYDDTEFLSRSTMVFRKENRQWKVAHVHFSKAEQGPRPGDV